MLLICASRPRNRGVRVDGHGGASRSLQMAACADGNAVAEHLPAGILQPVRRSDAPRSVTRRRISSNSGASIRRSARWSAGRPSGRRLAQSGCGCARHARRSHCAHAPSPASRAPRPRRCQGRATGVGQLLGPPPAGRVRRSRPCTPRSGRCPAAISLRASSRRRCASLRPTLGWLPRLRACEAFDVRSPACRPCRLARLIRPGAP